MLNIYEMLGLDIKADEDTVRKRLAQMQAATAAAERTLLDADRREAYNTRLFAAYPALQPQLHPVQATLIQCFSKGVILDTETTGLDKDSEIIEISVIDMQGNVLLNTLVKPFFPYDDTSEAAEIHGITREELNNAPTWPEIFPTLKSILQEKVLIAYNVNFDMRLIRQTNGIYRLSMPKMESVCAMGLFGDWSHHSRQTRVNKRFKLSDAALSFGIMNHQAHRALSDCQTTLSLMQAMYAKPPQPKRKSSDPVNHLGHLKGVNVVITGITETPRTELENMAAEAGARCTSGVSKKTEYLVLGETDFDAVKGDMSTKERKARELMEQGSPIQIISEAEFLELLKR